MDGTPRLIRRGFGYLVGGGGGQTKETDSAPRVEREGSTV